MRTHRIWAMATLAVLSSIAAASCGPGGGGGTGGAGGGGDTTGGGSDGAGGDGGGTGGGSGGPSKWYLTCGDPVCGGHTPQQGVPTCTTEVEGTACDTPDAACDPVNDCNQLLLCTTSDPQQQPGGCPISRARYKREIQYLPEAELERVRDELVSMPLATWRYLHEEGASREHLGFIIDDNPESPAVASGGNHVDLYGYTSMTVAAIQVQQKQIAALEQELAALRRELAALRAAPPAAPRPAAGQASPPAPR